jgi:hypothetical protein
MDDLRNRAVSVRSQAKIRSKKKRQPGVNPTNFEFTTKTPEGCFLKLA